MIRFGGPGYKVTESEVATTSAGCMGFGYWKVVGLCAWHDVAM